MPKYKSIVIGLYIRLNIHPTLFPSVVSMLTHVHKSTKRYNYMKRNINHTLKAVGQSLPK